MTNKHKNIIYYKAFLSDCKEIKFSGSGTSETTKFIYTSRHMVIIMTRVLDNPQPDNTRRKII
jgi:hypothetical protein